MRIFKTRQFSKWADDEGLIDESLKDAVNEITQGLVDAKLGGSVYKKRIGIAGRGKRGGVRTLLAYVEGDRSVFMYGFAKNQRENISKEEKQALKDLAKVYLAYSDVGLKKAIKAKILIEVESDE